MSSKNDKGNKVALVVIRVEDNHRNYNHPQLIIYNHYHSDNSCADYVITFQRNALDREKDDYTSCSTETPCDTRYVAKSQVGLWSGAYAPRIDEFRVCVSGIEDLLKLIKKIERAIEVYNIRFVTDDELERWHFALEKLRYETLIEFWKDGIKVNRYDV